MPQYRSIYLKDEEDEWLEETADRLDISKSRIIRNALEYYRQRINEGSLPGAQIEFAQLEDAEEFRELHEEILSDEDDRRSKTVVLEHDCPFDTLCEAVHHALESHGEDLEEFVYE